MSSIPHNQNKENEVFEFAAKFISEIQIGKLLFKCNAGRSVKFNNRPSEFHKLRKVSRFVPEE